MWQNIVGSENSKKSNEDVLKDLVEIEKDKQSENI